MFPDCRMEAGLQVGSAGQVLLPGGHDCYDDHDVIWVTSRSGADGAKDGGGVDGEVEEGVRPRIPPTLNIVVISWCCWCWSLWWWPLAIGQAHIKLQQMMLTNAETMIVDIKWDKNDENLGGAPVSPTSGPVLVITSPPPFVFAIGHHWWQLVLIYCSNVPMCPFLNFQQHSETNWQIAFTSTMHPG